jgi:hypothetical protein
MKVKTHRAGIAALALVVCLSFSPVAAAVQPNDGAVGVREKIVRILKKLKTLGSVTVFTDFPVPPRPTP